MNSASKKYKSVNDTLWEKGFVNPTEHESKIYELFSDTHASYAYNESEEFDSDALLDEDDFNTPVDKKPGEDREDFIHKF